MMSHPLKSAVNTTRRRWLVLNEDWLAVGLGGLSIALVLAGVRPTLPIFAWTSAADLTRTIFGTQNLANLLIAGTVIGLLASVGVLLTKESVARFAIGFPMLFALACAALLMA